MQRIQLPVESEEITLADIIENPLNYFIFFRNEDKIVGVVLYESCEREFLSYTSTDRGSVDFNTSLIELFNDFKRRNNFPNLEIFAQKI